MCKKTRSAAGAPFAAFGAGLLVGTVLPAKIVILLLGVALVLCGISCGKRG